MGLGQIVNNGITKILNNYVKEKNFIMMVQLKQKEDLFCK